MDYNNKQILLEEVGKLDEILKTLDANFDCENEISDEYSFLGIVKDNLADWAINNELI